MLDEILKNMLDIAFVNKIEIYLLIVKIAIDKFTIAQSIFYKFEKYRLEKDLKLQEHQLEIKLNKKKQ
jgi:hypothetical protein